MNSEKSLHSICRWTFNAGKGGFTPADMRPEWNMSTVDVIQLIKSKIAPITIWKLMKRQLPKLQMR